MSEEDKTTDEKIGCGARLGMAMLIAAILAVVFFLLINPMLQRRNIDLPGMSKLRGFFSSQNGSGSTAEDQEEQTQSTGVEVDAGSETDAVGEGGLNGENIESGTPQPVQVIGPDGSVLDNSSESWY